MLSPVETEETLGEAEVRALFRVSRLGTIAGCMVTSGVVRRGAQVRVIRDGTVVYETSIAQLKRFKDDAREVAEGFECGILLDGFNDVKEGDILEVYETREVERTDLDTPSSSSTGACHRTRLSSLASRGHRLRGIPDRELHFPESGLAEGKAEVREVGQGAATERLALGSRR
jgi:predicted membrane GTPase involved in stress response